MLEKKRQRESSSQRPLGTRASVMIYWASINILIINIIINVLFLTYNIFSITSHRPTPPSKVLALIGVSLCVLCLILWIGHVTSIHKINGPLAKAIWRSFVITMLTTSIVAWPSIKVLDPPVTLQLFPRDEKGKPKSDTTFIWSREPDKLLVGMQFAVIVKGYDGSNDPDLTQEWHLVGRHFQQDQEIVQTGPVASEGFDGTLALAPEAENDLKEASNKALFFIAKLDWWADMDWLNSVYKLRLILRDHGRELGTKEIEVKVVSGSRAQSSQYTLPSARALAWINPVQAALGSQEPNSEPVSSLIKGEDPLCAKPSALNMQ